MIINIPKDGRSRPAADPVDAPLAVDGATEEAGDPVGDLDHASSASPEMSPPADGTQSSGIRLRDMRGGGGSSLLAQRLKGYDSLTRRIIVSAEREMRAFASPAELSRTRSAAAEASCLFGDMQRMDRTFGAFGGLLSGASEIAGLQSYAFRDLEMIKSAAASVAEAAGVRDELTKTFQDVQICLGHDNREARGWFLGSGSRRQRFSFDSLLGVGGRDILRAATEAEKLKWSPGSLQGNAYLALLRDALAMVRGFPRDFAWAEALRPYDRVPLETWAKAAGEPWLVLPAPSAPPKPKAVWLAEDLPARRADAKNGAIIPPAAKTNDLTVLLKVARLMGWEPDRLIEALTSPQDVQAETAAPRDRRVWSMAPATRVRPVTGPGDRTVAIRDRGKGYEVCFGGQSVDCPRLKGLAILKILVENPDKKFGVMDLWAEASGVGPRQRTSSDQATRRPQSRNGGVVTRSANTDAIPIADEQAILDYKSRLESLSRELAVAERDGDLATQRRLSEEREAILACLPFPRGGKAGARIHSEQEEKARKNVANLIEIALKAIREEDPAIEKHLRSRLKKGYTCRYIGVASTK